MLKRFSVENFTSFDTEQQFDLTAGTTRSLDEHIVDFDSVKILKTGVIYGANASGKSNLIRAIDFAKSAIIKGLNNTNSYKKYFRLKKGSSDNKSSFEFEIEYDGQFFAYGFSCILKSGIVKEEWLFEIGKSKPIKLFERNDNSISLGSKLTSGKNKDRFEIYTDDMNNQPNKLFLSEIAKKELNLEELKGINNIYNWFNSKLEIIYPNDKHCGVKSITEDLVSQLTKYLSKFDTGVVSICSVEEDFETALKDFPSDFRDMVVKDFSTKKMKEAAIISQGDEAEFLTLHKNQDDEIKVRKLAFTHGSETQETFELKEESDGTRRLLDFIPLISRLLSDHTILIDEFDRSLHPKLTREFFNLFHSIKDQKSQLIVTTHESTLLDLDLLRRDEIWFVEKTDKDNSVLFSLNSFKERYDKKVEKAYLMGRYGAVPIFKSFENIN